MGPSSVHLGTKPDKTVTGFAPVICYRLYKSALHLFLTWGRSRPPSPFRELQDGYWNFED